MVGGERWWRVDASRDFCGIPLDTVAQSWLDDGMLTDEELAHLFDTDAIAAVLDDQFKVRRVRRGRITLITEAQTINAADWLVRQGVAAQARLTATGWEVEV